MEQAINQILRHLKLEEIETTTTNNQDPEVIEPETSRVIPEPEASKLDKGKGLELTKPPPTSPLAIINAITRGNKDPEKKIKNLSQAFAKYHQET